jgi:NAD(P)-dependent dehydrogenase (short-subunit alcohol dehydrogenase family)
MKTPGGRRIWLTDAGSALGLPLAEELLKAGHHLALTALDPAPVRSLQQRYPEQILLLSGDVSDGVQVTAIADQITRSWGALDCAIINVGTGEDAHSEAMNPAAQELQLRSNLLACTYCAHEALILLRQGNLPHLIGVCSPADQPMAASRQLPNACRAAQRFLFESLRADLAGQDIDITLVSAGLEDMPETTRRSGAPARWPMEKAAGFIARHLQHPRRPKEIVFPGRLIQAVRLAHLLPTRMQLALGKRLNPPSNDIH